jgi:acyl carrier protein
MDDESVNEGVHAILREVFAEGANFIGPDTIAADVPGWDSMKMITIILAVERRFEITLHNQDINKLRRVGDLIALVEQKSHINTSSSKG